MTLVLRGVLLSLTSTGWSLYLGGVAESDPVDVALEFLDAALFDCWLDGAVPYGDMCLVPNTATGSGKVGLAELAESGLLTPGMGSG